jgi:hypothetical protein
MISWDHELKFFFNKMMEMCFSSRGAGALLPQQGCQMASFQTKNPKFG